MVETEDLIALILSTSDHQELSAIGKKLSVAQFLNILSETEQRPKDFSDRVSPLLVGLPPPIFEQSLSFVDSNHLDALKKEAAAAPLQHHLTLLVHEQEAAWEGISQVRNRLFKMIDTTDLEIISSQEIENIQREASATMSSVHHRLNNIGLALALAWNTGRIDLVDRLSVLKEHLSLLRISTNKLIND